MKLSIILPVYNEEKTVIQVLEKIVGLKISWEKEIIIVNDGSSDSTAGLIKKFIKRQKSLKNIKVVTLAKNSGKGKALSVGFNISSGEYVLIQDADLEYRPVDIPALLEKARNGVAVFGNRFNKKGFKMPFLYYLGNKFLTFCTNFLYKTNLSDMETGYKLLPGSFVKNLSVESSRFDFEPEITVKLSKSKIPIIEVPISYQGRSHFSGKKLTVKDSIGALITLIKYKSVNWDVIFLSGMLFILFLIFSVIALSSHNHFLTFGWDLGYFDQLIWKVSRGIYPYSTLSKVNLLAGHFAPVLFLFAPLYLFWSDPRMLLLAQAVIVISASYPLYFLSKKLSKSSIFSFSIVFSYLFFLGTQWTILNEFHEASVTPLFIALFFYAASSKKNFLMIVSLLGLLGTKEEFSLLTASLSFPIYFYFKKKKLGLFFLFFSLLFFFFLTEIFMPSISEKGTYQFSNLSSVAGTPLELTKEIIRNPIFFLQSIVTPPVKIQTLFLTLGAFAFLPVLAPFSILIPSIEQILMRGIYTGPQFTFYLNVNHHAAPLAILFPIACIYALVKLTKKYPDSSKKILIAFSVVLISATIYQDISNKAPIHSIFKSSLYDEEIWMKNARDILNLIPKDASVATQNSLFPHLSQRSGIFLLPEINNAHYIAVDLHDGPNKYAPLLKNDTEELVENLIQNGKYEINARAGEAFLLKKIIP